VTRPGGYEIRITPWAAQQLKEEMAWSRRRWGRQHQLAYRRALLERLERIAAGPHGYRERPELGTGVRLVHHRGLYVVFVINEELHQVEVIGFPNVYRDLGRSVADSLEAWRSAAGESKE
jgi:plasmid stabilization system protein ParE